MRTTSSLVAALMLAMTACGGPSDQGGGAAGRDRSGDRDTVGAPEASADGRAAIYAAVVRQLVTKDHTFGSAPSPFKRIYIVDGVVADASDPRMPAYLKVARPFPSGVKRGIVRRLADLPHITFVTDSARVIVDDKDCPRVKGEGVLISLGPISEAAGRVTVANGLFFACLGGQWLTYALERFDGDWRVVGTRGPVAIS